MLDPVCSICLDAPVFSEEAVSSLRCGHIFHQPCLNDWIRQNQFAPSCPQCRNPCDATQLTNLVVIQGTEAPTAAQMEEARRLKELEDAAEETEAMLRDIKAGAAAHRESLRRQKEADRAAIVAVNAGQEGLNSNHDLFSHLEKFSSIPLLVEDLKKRAAAVNFDQMKQDLKNLFKEFFDANLPAAHAAAGTGAAGSSTGAGAAAAAWVPRPGLRRSTRRAASRVGNAGIPKRSRGDMPAGRN